MTTWSAETRSSAQRRSTDSLFFGELYRDPAAAKHRKAPNAWRLALILVVLSASSCKDGEWLADPTPDYYYCLKLSATSIHLLPGEVAVVNLVDGPCEEWGTWKKAERRPISEALPFNVRIQYADEGITISPTGSTSSNQITIRTDASLAAKPWLLADFHSAGVLVTLQNPRRASRGYTKELKIIVDDPNRTAEPVKKPNIDFRFAQSRISFANVKISSEASIGASVYNQGTEDGTIATVAWGNCSVTPCPFQVIGLSAGEKIPAGSYRTLTVAFKPTVTGYASAELFVNPTQGYGTTVGLSGTGQ